MNTAIVVPTYKPVLSKEEELSLIQCLQVLGRYDIYLCMPQSLDISYYKQFLESAKVKKYDDYYFKSLKGYNLWCQSSTFYRSFLKYNYLLIHQLDAYVFKDNLDYWCSLKYDYIGAPWLKQKQINELYECFLERHRKKLKFFRLFGKDTRRGCLVGNGGLSLRNVKKHYFYSFLLRPFIEKINKRWMNEDIFWCIYVRELMPSYSVPEASLAAKFSIELDHNETEFEAFDELPFGCHGWSKSEQTREFWCNYIQLH